VCDDHNLARPAFLGSEVIAVAMDRFDALIECGMGRRPPKQLANDTLVVLVTRNSNMGPVVECGTGREPWCWSIDRWHLSSAGVGTDIACEHRNTDFMDSRNDLGSSEQLMHVVVVTGTLGRRCRLVGGMGGV
jgi:hypothetical protein